MRISPLLPYLEKRHGRLAFRAAFLAYLAVLGLGSIPGARAEMGEVASGLILHALTYGAIAFLLFIGGSGAPLRRAVTSCLIVAAMGAGDEWLQSFFPYRTAALTDWLVDAGAALATCIALFIVRSRQNDAYRPADRPRPD